MKYSFTHCYVLVTFIFILLGGCQDALDNSKVQKNSTLRLAKGGDLTGDYPNPQIAEGAVKSNRIFDSATTTASTSKSIGKTDVKIIKNAIVRIRVKESVKATSEIERILSQNNAYLNSQEQTKEDYSISNKAVIRVSKNNFDTLLKEIEAIAEQVDFKKVSIDDVTAEFVDVTARLKVKKETETQYYAILKQSHNVQDILDVQEHLSEIREEIDASEGKLKYMNDQVAYSTINLDYYEQLQQSSTPILYSFWEQIAHGFLIGWSSLLTFLIDIVSMWPFWFIIASLFIAIKRVVKRKLRIKADKKT